MRRWLWPQLGIWLLTGTALGDPPPNVQLELVPWSELPMIVLVNHCGAGCLVQMPDGVEATDSAYIITAAHVVLQTDELGRCPVTCWVGSGERTYTAEIVARDLPSDAALLRVEGAALPPVRLTPRTTAAVAGEIVTVYGFSVQRGRLVRDPSGIPLLHVARGPITEIGPGIVRMDTGQRVSSILVRIPFAVEGMSGGPVVDELGGLVGLLAGISAQDEGVAVCGPPTLATLFSQWNDRGIAGQQEAGSEQQGVPDPLRALWARDGVACSPAPAATDLGARTLSAATPTTAAGDSPLALELTDTPLLQAAKTEKEAQRDVPAQPAATVVSAVSAAGEGAGHLQIRRQTTMDRWDHPGVRHPGEARLEGRIAAPDGRPVRGVVIAMCARCARSRGETEPEGAVVVAVARIDPEGNRFDLGWLPGGTYELQVAVEGYSLQTEAGLALDPETATTITWSLDP